MVCLSFKGNNAKYLGHPFGALPQLLANRLDATKDSSWTGQELSCVSLEGQRCVGHLLRKLCMLLNSGNQKPGDFPGVS